MVPDPTLAASPFDEWGRLTRFLRSAQLAFARERDHWASLSIDDPDRVRISAPEGGYRVKLKRHLDAVEDEETLHASVLIHSYALVESAAANRLGMNGRSFCGIEDWGAKLLTANDRDWSDVEGGLSGAVEVAVVRNAFAHGSRLVDAAARARLRKFAARTRPVGSRLTLSYAELRVFRARLKSLMNVGGIRA